MISREEMWLVNALTRLKRGLNAPEQHPRFLTKVEEIREIYAIETRSYYSRKEASRLGWYDFVVSDTCSVEPTDG